MRNRILAVIGITALVGLVLYLLGVRMTKADLHISAAAEPLFCMGGTLKGEVCEGGVPFTNSLLMTILIDIILVIIAVQAMGKPRLIPTGLQNTVEALIEAFYDFAKGVDRKNVAKFFPLPATIFCFFLVANMLALVPGVGSIGVCHAAEKKEASLTAVAAEGVEPNAFFANWPGACYGDNKLIPLLRAPAADLNVTLAFGLVAGIMVQVFGIQALGVSGYFGKFFINPFKEGALQTLIGILEFIGEFTRIIAFTFRIFGNIFGGEVILVVMAFLFPYILPLPFYGLEVFVAFIQAVIFAVLTLVFFSLAVQAHGGHDDHGHDEKAAAH
ncbi:MAG: F0F1 ATP synthase subunit A [Roseiflexaceae bacterium]